MPEEQLFYLREYAFQNFMTYFGYVMFVLKMPFKLVSRLYYIWFYTVLTISESWMNKRKYPISKLT